MTQVDPNRMANAIRGLAMDGVEKAKSGHPGLPMGAADMATVLFTQFLKFDAAVVDWPDRDRFVLSAGHGSMLLYALLYLTGNADMTLDQLKQFRQLGGLTPGHPENFHTKGIETTTGPLGQGISTAVGMALAEKMLAAEFGKKIVDHHTYVIASDGDLMEGISQEAIAMAGHWKLGKLIVLYDDNGISIDGPTSIADSVDQVKRFKACGWAAEKIDGHDQAAIAAAITRAQKSNKPTLIACRTTIGFGAPHKAGTAKAHGEALGPDELKAAKENLGISLEPFSVPDDVLKAWRAAGSPRRHGTAGMGRPARRARQPQARRVRAPPAPRASGVAHQGRARLQEGAAGKADECGDPQIVGSRDRGDRRRDADGIPRRLRRPHRLQQQQGEVGDRLLRQDAEGPLHPLRHPRARHGGCDERHLPARRLCAERRDLPGVHRLRAACDAPRRADGHRRRLRDDARFHRPRRRRPDPSAGRASRSPSRHSEHACVPPRAIPSRSPSAGSSRSIASTVRPCWR